eukprot:TRINITY_DN90_c0_g1_i1.p2 TRINITY_DN90_c0_g1~~TRINITY_DN90_c0_g1_i1.p2  ORF type:complete len:111 (-),score=18.99 TRINITY_DN90_c0_g1_i1:227-559(-)
MSSTPRGASSGSHSVAVTTVTTRQRPEVVSPPIMAHTSAQNVQQPPQTQPMQQTTHSSARHGLQSPGPGAAGVSILGHAFGNTFVDLPPRESVSRGHRLDGISCANDSYK